jgi:hypothetical protein
MKPPKAPPKAAKSSPGLPPGAAGVPGTKAWRAVQKAPRPAPVVVDAHQFTKDPRGGAELKVGKANFEMRDDRTRTAR